MSREQSGPSILVGQSLREGEMARMLRATDWSATPLGPIADWPQALRVAVGICLNSRFPMFVWWGPQLINIYNDGYIPMLGKKHPAAFGTPARPTWSDVWEIVGRQADRVMTRGEATWNDRVKLVMERHGYWEETWFTWSYSPIPDDHGGIGGLFCAVTEETGQVMAERERDALVGQLAAERATLANVFAQSPAFLAVMRGPAHVFEIANERYLDLVGRRDVVGKPVAVALPEVVEQGFVGLLDRVYATGEPYVGTGTRVMLLRAGPGGGAPRMEERFVDFVYQPLRDPSGAVTGILTHGVDVTERKLAEAAIAREAALLTNVRDSVIVTDLKGIVTYWNTGATRLFGWTADEMVGRPLAERLPREKRGAVTEWVAKIAQGDVEFEGEWLDYRKDGTPVWIEVNTQLARGASGEPLGIIGVSREITQRKEAEAQLKASRDAAERSAVAAEAASRAKDEFLAVLSHELRTPLTPVLLTASLLESNPKLPEEFRGDVATIRRNVELESRLISDLLDLTRVARGKLHLDEQEVDLHLLIRAAVDICQREASARLNVDLAARRHVVRGDPTRLQQIFWNLVSNAMKFTPPEGTITVRSRDAAERRIRVEVIDTGVGIDPAVLPRLFSAFEQGEVRAVTQQAGLGLGLAISRRLAEAHGGTIAASSGGRGQGATFTVELPALDVFVPREAPAPVRGTDANGRSLSVLLVEDHEPSLRVLTKLLSQLGHKVTGANSVATATAATGHTRFDVIISDLGLPDGSGLDVMRRLKDTYAGRAIALTGYGMESDVAASREAGFAEHLTKPVDIPRLQEAIARVTARGEGGGG